MDERVIGYVVVHQRARSDHRVRADPHAAQHRHVGSDPDVIAERDRAAALLVFGVEVVLIGVDQAATGADPGAPPAQQGVLRREVAAVQPRVGTEHEPRSGKHRDMYWFEFGAQPRSRADLDVRAGTQQQRERAGRALGRDVRADLQHCAGTHHDARAREVGAGAGIDRKPGVEGGETAQLAAVGGLDRPQQPATRERHRQRTWRG